METLWFWLVSVISASPAGMRETSLLGLNLMKLGVSHG
jgi:hypothetical protein